MGNLTEKLNETICIGHAKLKVNSILVEVPFFFLFERFKWSKELQEDGSTKWSKAEREQGALCHPEGHL